MTILALTFAFAMQQPVETIQRTDSLLGPTGAFDVYKAPKGPRYALHDHIRIVVQERARARAQADFRNDRRSRTEVKLDAWPALDTRSAGFPPRLGAAALAGDPEIDMDARYRNDNRGATSRDFDLTFTVMAEVVEVLPNGNVRLEARKERRVNEEEEIIRITGEVSLQFIVANTVNSENIMNLRVDYNGTGSVSDSSDQGLVGWVVSKIWPF